MGLEKSAWLNEGSAAASTPTPMESFNALDAEGRTPARAASLHPVTSCPLPYLEVLLQDADGKPLAGVPCELAFPAGGGKKATTNADGRAHFPNVDVDASTLVLEIREQQDERGALTYLAKVLPRPAQDSRGSTGGQEEEPVPLYYPGSSVRLR
jgi:hypothetical protein